MGPLSLDLRVRIVEAYERGEGSVRELAERFMVAPKSVQTYRKLWKVTGSVLPRPHGGGRGRKIDDALLRLRNVDALVLLAYPPDDGFAREVERRVALTPTAQTFHVVARLPFAGGKQQYVVLRAP